MFGASEHMLSTNRMSVRNAASKAASLPPEAEHFLWSTPVFPRR